MFVLIFQYPLLTKMASFITFRHTSIARRRLKNTCRDLKTVPKVDKIVIQHFGMNRRQKTVATPRVIKKTHANLRAINGTGFIIFDYWQSQNYP